MGTLAQKSPGIVQEFFLRRMNGMKMFKSKKFLALAIALVAILGTTATVYAAAGAINYSKVGDKYVVDYVVTETTVDGIVVQTVERKFIPENRFNVNDPRNPIPSVPTPPNPTKVQQLRQAGLDSKNDLQTYAWSYQWSTTTIEKSASDTELRTDITFQVDASASADRWVCTFNQVVKFDSSGNPYVKYYIGSQEYSVAAIKRMFAAYGKAR